MLHARPAQDAPPAAPTDPSPAAAPASGPDPARALIERQLHALTRLTDIGMEIAEAAGRRAVAVLDGDPTAPAPAVDPGLTFARVSRAVRMTIALQSRLLADLAALDKAQAQDRQARAGGLAQLIHRRIERAVEAEYDDEETVERLSGEAQERLWDEEAYGDLLDRPIAETVARICRDLGLPPEIWPDMSALTEQDRPAPPGPPDGPAAEPRAFAAAAAPGPWLTPAKAARPDRPP